MPKDVDIVTLTYRQLADQLGISVVAARTRARRAAAAGRWRIVAGNRPGAPSYAQIPASEVAAMQKGKSKEEIIRRSRPAAHEQGDAGIAKDQIVLEALRSAYRHIERLNQIVLVEKDERRVAELRMMSAERTKEQLKSEVAKLEHWVRALDQKLASAEAGRDRLAVEAAELRASDRQWARQVLGLESRLRQSLRKARQPWWMRLFAKR